ncbi:MAG: hypothetical protein KDB01_17515 [Planctomycetaceae bacterium]|nr:hypothetical protein [Planctomycetaceae bacterium]
MKPRTITSMFVTLWLLLAINPLHAWQADAVSGNEKKPDSSGFSFFQPDSNQLHAPSYTPDLDSQIKQLKNELESLNGDARSDILDTDRKAVRYIVERMFDTRQQLQRLEAQRMRLKLQKIEANLDAREKSRDTIIDQRVKKLIHRQDQVETTQEGPSLRNETAMSTSIGLQGLPAASTPIGLPGPPAFTGDAENKSSQIHRNSGASIQWPQPGEIVKDLRQHRDFGTAFLRHQKLLQSRIERFSASLEELKRKGFLDSNALEKDRLAELESLRDELAVSQYGNKLPDWKRAWSTYQSRLRLLKLDVEEAKLAFESRTMQNERVRNMHETGFVSIDEVQKAASELTAARFALLRAEELLKLYADIETQEPDLNPDSFKAEK